MTTKSGNLGWLLVLALIFLSGCAGRHTLNMSAEDARIIKGVDLPVDVPIAIYVPETHLNSRFYVSSVNTWVTPGEALRNALDTVAAAYFVKHAVIGATDPSDDEYGLVATLAPEWDYKAGKVSLTLGYRVYDASGEQLRKGEVVRAKPIGTLHDSSGFYNAALKTMQIVLVETINSVFRDGRQITDHVAMNGVDPDLLVNMDEPVRTGTAFFISNAGQLYTAAHVVDGCLRAQIEYEDGSHQVDVLAESALLDVALLQSTVETDYFLSLRAKPQVILGERVSAAGFPLQNVLANSANLTVGNVSSMDALPGSLGKFQFSAPIQPGSSGSPIVSEKGELLGMTTGTLNVSVLIEKGIIPQNVNFALDGQYLAKFAERHSANVQPFDINKALPDVAAVNEHLVASVAQVACYQ